MFWCLQNVEKDNSYGRSLADSDKGVEFESIICPVDPGHQRGGKRLSDWKIVLPRQTVDDFVWMWGDGLFVQGRTVRLFREAGLTGFDVRPVQARFKRSAEKPPVLWELCVTGWGGIAPPESGMRLNEKKSCPVCGHLNYTSCTNLEKLIDESQWDGSDFFFVWPLPLFRFVTDRVAELIREKGLTGVRLVKPTSIGPIEGASPGRLHYYLPEERAHEIGDPLGIY